MNKETFHAAFLSTMLIFALMLISSFSSFGLCLFSRHAYFRTNAYFRVSTVLEAMVGLDNALFDLFAAVSFDDVITCLWSKYSTEIEN